MPSTASPLTIADPTTLVNARRASGARASRHGQSAGFPSGASADQAARRTHGSRSGQTSRPHLTPVAVPSRESRRAPLVVRVNTALRTALIALCGVVIFGYGFDVARTNDMTRMQEQARRLSEQNSELSAQLLRAISFEGIQDSVLGRCGLRVPEHVLIVKEITPPKMSTFHPSKYHLPIMSGY